MPRKSYRQFCGVARALDRVGERWTLLIVRNLLLGPRRYSDLLAELPGMTTNLLAKRLRELEESRIVDKQLLPAPLAVSVYRLTEQGRALEPVILELGRWGARFMSEPQRGDTFNLGWAFLSLKRRYLGGLSCTVLVEPGERAFTLEFSPDHLRVEERRAERPDLSLAGDEATIRALFFRGQAWSSLLSSGKLRSSGPKSLERALERALRPPEWSVASAGETAQAPAITRRRLSSKKRSVGSKLSA
ncbi:MAG TPA: winged helix-turn-helix transcriptional regulator [Polyangiaceae bacterium]|nr:winged helix-turn-helix transcriptional regulator [Polyangiaceae bacterium]